MQGTRCLGTGLLSERCTQGMNSSMLSIIHLLLKEEISSDSLEVRVLLLLQHKDEVSRKHIRAVRTRLPPEHDFASMLVTLLDMDLQISS